MMSRCLLVQTLLMFRSGWRSVSKIYHPHLCNIIDYSKVVGTIGQRHPCPINNVVKDGQAGRVAEIAAVR